MVVLKKVKASTIMETLVATVLIIVIFMVSSLILNNVFSNTIKSNTRGISSHLNELEYLHHHDKLSLPYHDDYEGWTISVTKSKSEHPNEIIFSAFNPLTDKIVEVITYKE